MRALVDIDEGRIRELDRLAKQQRQSRAALIREAIDTYLERHSQKTTAEAFGLWGDGKVDGLAYQEEVRGEW